MKGVVVAMSAACCGREFALGLTVLRGNSYLRGFTVVSYTSGFQKKKEINS